MQACGNDYIYVDCTKNKLEKKIDFSLLSKKLSKRKFSIGADGIILICRSYIAEAKMVMYNADSSEGKMCGNGIRCVAKYLYEILKIKKSILKIETKSGVKEARVFADPKNDFKAGNIEVNMGEAEFLPQKIPVDILGLVRSYDCEALAETRKFYKNICEKNTEIFSKSDTIVCNNFRALENTLKKFKDENFKKTVQTISCEHTENELGKEIYINNCPHILTSVINFPVKINDSRYFLNCVSMGNPHCVLIYKENINNIDLEKVALDFERSKIFLEGINIEIVNVKEKNTVDVRVWERGSKETFSCGTGACATFAVLNKLGLIDSKIPLTVNLKGGQLEVSSCEGSSKDSIFLCGPAEIVYRGIVEI